MMRTWKLMIAVVMLLALPLAAAGCGGEQDSGQVRSGEVQVNVKNLKYTPAKLTMKAGSRVTFTNQDAMTHDVVQVAVQELGKAKPGFDSGLIEPTKSWSIVMEKPGTYPILCTQSGHYTAGMVGTITVVE